MIRPTTSSGELAIFISDFVRGKKVLDVGCMAHSIDSADIEGWLHGYVVKNAASTLGLDILESDVALLRQRGFNVVCADAITTDLGDTFDTIIAGELIEHIENPGAFLSNMRRHLTADGELLITTPNVFFGLHFLESVFRSPYQSWNPQHVAWYCYFTLENMFSRAGLKATRCIYFTRSRKLRKILNLFGVSCPAVLASTLLMIGRRDAASGLPSGKKEAVQSAH
jgi:2-polyprenyl-3-methyl-5-hydroxy-6-metoxy-1,4-benzoquinol methylase